MEEPHIRRFYADIVPGNDYTSVLRFERKQRWLFVSFILLNVTDIESEHI